MEVGVPSLLPHATIAPPISSASLSVNVPPAIVTLEPPKLLLCPWQYIFVSRIRHARKNEKTSSERRERRTGLFRAGLKVLQTTNGNVWTNTRNPSSTVYLDFLSTMVVLFKRFAFTDVVLRVETGVKTGCRILRMTVCNVELALFRALVSSRFLIRVFFFYHTLIGGSTRATALHRCRTKFRLWIRTNVRDIREKSQNSVVKHEVVSCLEYRAQHRTWEEKLRAH